MSVDRAPASLPSYAPLLEAFHRAHAPELEDVIAKSPIAPNMRVIDLCCGDGAHALWLARCVGKGGTVVGLDIDERFLQVAAARARAARPEASVVFMQGDAHALPFEARSFDAAWCAHSLYELDDPVGVLRGMRDVVRPGGAVCVLENDRLHHALLPWPADLEIAVQRAYRQAIRARRGPDAERFYVARHLPRLFREAGLEGARVETVVTARHAPLGPEERAYLDLLLDELGRRAWRYLGPGDRHAFEAWRAGRGEAPAPDDPSFSVTYLDVLASAEVPEDT